MTPAPPSVNSAHRKAATRRPTPSSTKAAAQPGNDATPTQQKRRWAVTGLVLILGAGIVGSRIRRELRE